jgi:hypothetical protein
VKAADYANQMSHRACTYVGMQIADVKDCEILKCRGKIGESHTMLFYNNVISVSTRTAIKSSQLQCSSDNPRRRVPVFKIEEDQSLSKQLRLVLDFDFQPPLNMFCANSLDQVLQGRFGRNVRRRMQSLVSFVLGAHSNRIWQRLLPIL